MAYAALYALIAKITRDCPILHFKETRRETMDQESTTDVSRRTVLKQMYFLACVVPISIMANPDPSGARAKTGKAEANYQDQPKGNQKCAECVYYFLPDRNACKIVEGEISPQGWCKFWKAK
jgi:hypothetical protein